MEQTELGVPAQPPQLIISSGEYIPCILVPGTPAYPFLPAFGGARSSRLPSFLLSQLTQKRGTTFPETTSSDTDLLCLLLSHKCLLYRNKGEVRIAVQTLLSLLGLAIGCLCYSGDNSYSVSFVLHAMAKAKKICLAEN